jgi:hypothetical protein
MVSKHMRNFRVYSSAPGGPDLARRVLASDNAAFRSSGTLQQGFRRCYDAEPLSRKVRFQRFVRKAALGVHRAARVPVWGIPRWEQSVRGREGRAPCHSEHKQ